MDEWGLTSQQSLYEFHLSHLIDRERKVRSMRVSFEKVIQWCVYFYPDLQFDAFVVPVDGLDFKIDAHGGHEGGREGVVCVAEEKRRLPHRGVADDEQLEHVVKVLVRRVLLPLSVAGALSHAGLHD